MPRFRILTGDCLPLLRAMEPGSVDAVVTDPPYGLSFMGKRWDHDVPSVEVWAECLRVLKPGGHLLAFAGTRTQHRMACRIEDAGFEIRDMLAWVYGSGFPKSLDVGKAIDARGGAMADFAAFRDAVRAAMKRSGVSRAQLQAALGNHMLDRYLTEGSQPAVPNLSDYRIIRDTVSLGDEFDALFADEAAREVVGRKQAGITNPTDRDRHTIGGSASVVVDITAPATAAAKQWDGWGTALKPSHEPLTWATKPLTSVPHDAIVLAEQAIGSLICLSLSHAKHAETLLRSSRREFGEGVASALLIAAVHRGLSSADPSEVTAMFKSPETARTILSIAESWSAILGAYSEHRNTFTTSTAIGLTTALRTFACLTLQTIADSITPDGERMLGQLLSAPIAEVDLSDTSVRQAKSTSVRGLVSLLTGRSVASVAEASFMPAARTGSSVLRDAITTLGERTRPSLEPITLARKPLIGTVAANVLTHGTGALNIDGCRVGTTVETWPSSRSYHAARGPKPRGAHGSGDGDTIGTGDAPPGRFPANLMYDGSDEVVGMFPNSTSTGTAGSRESDIYGKFNAPQMGQPVGFGDSGSAARFFYCAKASGADRGATNNHATVKPTDLMRYLCRLVTPPGGVVLDPFAGSGSTGRGAVMEGFHFIGCELDPAYAALAEKRIAEAMEEVALIAQTDPEPENPSLFD